MESFRHVCDLIIGLISIPPMAGNHGIFDAVGYDYRYAGENLARDFSTTGPMIKAWMSSQTHKDNIVSTRYQETGIGVVNGVLSGLRLLLSSSYSEPKNRGVAAVPQITNTGLQAEVLEAKAPEVLSVRFSPAVAV